MSDEKMSAEEPNLRQQIMMELNQQYILGHQQGQLVGYARGKAEERERIWEAMNRAITMPVGGTPHVTFDTFKQIIFGGGDDNK